MSILATSRRSFADVATGVGVVGAAFLLYFLTAARDIVVGDTPELITAAVTLGVVHPPGYPLFTVLGHLFSLLPVGPIPFRVNLLSVACDALTVGLVYFTALRLSRHRVAAALAALLLAVSPIFWRWSLASEVFPLNNLFVSLLVYLLVRWHEQPERTGFLFAAFFGGGLALTNHQTIVLLGPACCFMLWQGRAIFWRRPQILGFCLVAFLIGLLPYLYVPWAASRHPVLNWGGVSSLRDLAALIARRSYGSGQLVSTAGYAGGSIPDRVIVLVNSFGPTMGLLVPIGFIHAYRNLRWYFWFSLLAFVFVGPFFVVITNLNLATAPSALFVLERFFLASHVVLAPLAALGIVTIARLLAPDSGALRIAISSLVAAAIAIVLSIVVLKNYHVIDQSHNHIARRFGEDVLATLAPGTILFATGDAIVLPLTYLRTVERIREDVILVLAPLLPAQWYLRQLQEHYPDLRIPFDYYDGQNNNIKMLVEANRERTIAAVGNLPGNDNSLNADYWPRQHGLVNIVESKSKKFTLPEIAKDNEQLLNRYRPPPAHGVRVKSFEVDILSLYAWPALRIGMDYERSGDKREAWNWYQRSFAIYPELPGLHEARAHVAP